MRVHLNLLKFPPILGKFFAPVPAFENPLKIEVRIRIIHLVRMQNFPQNYYFLPRDTHTFVRIRGNKMLVFRKILRAY